MNILAINKFSNINLWNLKKDSEATQSSRFGLKMSAPLTKDTVSFKAKTCFADALVQQASKDMIRLNRIGTTFLDSLESVANKLASIGVSFNRTYCEKNTVKSPESYVSKVKRSGSLRVADRVRATIFSKNIDDLSVFNKILEELSARDLVPATIEGNLDEMLLRGYTPTMDQVSGKSPVVTKDIDIRLSNPLNSIDDLSEYMYTQSGPQKSGYEDIQMRLVRQYDKNVNPVLLELIILSGKDYAFAKHLESEYVYTPIMKVFHEFNIAKKDRSKTEEYSLINRCSGTVKNILVKEVSQKLFENADIIDKNLPKELNEVNIKPEDVKQIERCMNIIKQSISLYYTNKLNRNDLCEATKIRLAKEFEADKETYNKLKKNVTTAIKFFNEKNYLERRKDFWPTLFGEEIKVD